jgi:hypothetical protein
MNNIIELIKIIQKQILLLQEQIDILNLKTNNKIN